MLKRNDNAIHLCEVKYYDGGFTVDAEYAKRLDERKRLFKSSTRTKAALFTKLIANNKLKDNEYALYAVDAHVTLKEIMD